MRVKAVMDLPNEGLSGGGRVITTTPLILSESIFNHRGGTEVEDERRVIVESACYLDGVSIFEVLKVKLGTNQWIGIGGKSRVGTGRIFRSL